MDENKNPNKNSEGYIDPTAGEAIKNADKNKDKESTKFYKLLYTIFNLCEIAGFELRGRITLVDKETGKIWR